MSMTWAESFRGKRLTARELEVLSRAADGRTDAEIGADLGISRNTVHNHRGRIVAKLGAASTTQAVAIALRQGLIA